MDLSGLIITLIILLDIICLGDSQEQPRRSKKNKSNKNIIMRGRKPEPTTSLLVERLLVNYIKSDPPNKVEPTEVKLGIYINSFYSISEQTMDYAVNFYLRQNWRDPRLEFQSKYKHLSEVKMADLSWDKIWVPDVFFRNEKKASYHQVTTHNRLLKLNSSGYLWYVTKISATLSCPMKLQKYPLDTQTCPMMFESFGYTMDVMFFNWLPEAAQMDPANEIPQFQLLEIQQFDCSQNYTAGAFPCLEIRFILRRDIGFFLIQVYIPTILIVILSWVSFWINVDAIPARVSLGLLTVLTMTTQSTQANQGMPRVSYIKAIDVWMTMCLIFVFAALLEFAVVNVISRKGVRTVNPVRRPAPSIQKLDAETPIDQINILDNRNNATKPKGPPPKTVDPEGKVKARKIDKVSRKLFPLAFLLFNIVYWIVYTVPGTVSGM